MLGLVGLKLLVRQHWPDVQFDSAPVAYPVQSGFRCVLKMRKGGQKRTGIEMEIGDVQNFEAFTTRRFRGWEWVGFRTRKPVGQVERGSRWQGTRAEEVLAD